VATNTLSSTPRTPVSISGYPSTVAMSPDGATAYVANQSAFTLTPIDVATDTAGSPISLPDVTNSIAITPDGSKAYLTSKAANVVIPVTLSTSTAETPISVGTAPTGIAIAPNGSKAYVANTGSNSVTPITLSTDTAGTAISVGTDPTSIAFTPDSSKAYVSNYNSSNVTPITVSTGTAGTAISTPATPTGIAITPDGSTAYVGSFTTNEVTAITLAHGTTSTPIHGLHGPTSIILTSHGTTAFVANWYSGSVTPVTLAIDRNESTISVSTNPHGLALTPSNSKLYVNDSTVGKITPVTISPTTVTVTHDHAYGYTADGQRCWSAPATTSGACTAAPSGATSDHWNTLQQLCWSGPTTTTGASCSSPPSGATTYTYDGQDLRMTETPPSGPALSFTWDTAAGSIPLDIDDGVNAYIYGPGTVPVEQVNLTTGSVDYLASAQDGVQTVFNSAGSVVQETDYTTYGTSVLNAGTDVTPFGFQGGYTDPSGTIYLINRYYTPKTDQFLSVDPDLSQTGEPYAFTNDDPLNLTDPLGLIGAGNFCSRYGSHSRQCKAATKAANALQKKLCKSGGCGRGGFTSVTHWVDTHHKAIIVTIGVVAGIAAAATGVGAVVEGATALSAAAGAGIATGEAASDVASTSVGLALTSAGTGAVATGLDATSCAGGDQTACVGATLGGVGTVAGALDFLPSLAGASAGPGLGAASASFGVAAAIYDAVKSLIST
jgi:RHS repeat-associated protein